MPFRGRFVTEQVTVRSSLLQTTVAFLGTFSKGKGYGDVRTAFLHCGDDVAHPFVGEPCVFAALQDECAEPCGIALLQTAENLLFCQTVADDGRVASADAAVQAVVFAEVAQFHQSAQEDGISEMLDAQIVGV